MKHRLIRQGYGRLQDGIGILVFIYDGLVLVLTWLNVFYFGSSPHD